MVDLLSFGCVAHCGFYHSSRKVSPMSLYNILFFSFSLDLSERIDENEMITKERMNRRSPVDARTA